MAASFDLTYEIQMKIVFRVEIMICSRPFLPVASYQEMRSCPSYHYVHAPNYLVLLFQMPRQSLSLHHSSISIPPFSDYYLMATQRALLTYGI